MPITFPDNTQLPTIEELRSSESYQKADEATKRKVEYEYLKDFDAVGKRNLPDWDTQRHTGELAKELLPAPDMPLLDRIVAPVGKVVDAGVGMANLNKAFLDARQYQTAPEEMATRIRGTMAPEMERAYLEQYTKERNAAIGNLAKQQQHQNLQDPLIEQGEVLTLKGFVPAIAKTAGQSLTSMAVESRGAALMSPFSAIAAGFQQEFPSSVMEQVREAGFDLSKPEDIERLFTDPKAQKSLAEAEEKGGVRAGVIATVDGVFQALGAKGATAFGKAATSGSGRLAREAGVEIGADVAGGGIGEVSARSAIGQEQSLEETILEAGGGLASAPASGAQIALRRVFETPENTASQVIRDWEEQAPTETVVPEQPKTGVDTVEIYRATHPSVSFEDVFDGNANLTNLTPRDGYVFAAKTPEAAEYFADSYNRAAREMGRPGTARIQKIQVSRSDLESFEQNDAEAVVPEILFGQQAAQPQPAPQPTPEPQTPPVEPQPAPQAPEAPSPAPRPEPLPKAPEGKRAPFEASIPNRPERVKGDYRIVELDDLITSDDPRFDGRLQPRQRNSVNSREQIQKIINEFDPRGLTQEDFSTDRGAMMIDALGQVLSGNGRTMVLREISQKYPKLKEAYFQAVQARAKELGINIGLTRFPVLVRQVNDFGGLTPEQFAEFSNQDQKLARGKSEIAEADAKAILENDLLRLFNPSETGDVLIAGNRDFNQAFVNLVDGGKSMVRDDGTFDPDLGVRVQRAVLAAIIGTQNRDIINDAISNGESIGIKNQLNGIMQVGGTLLKMGRDKPQYSLQEFLGTAIQELTKYRRGLLDKKYNTVQDFLDQGQLFETRDPIVETLVRHLAGAKSRKWVTDYFNAYAKAVDAIDTTTPDMFGAPLPTRQELLGISNVTQNPTPDPDIFGGQGQQGQGTKAPKPSPKPEGKKPTGTGGRRSRPTKPVKPEPPTVVTGTLPSGRKTQRTFPNKEGEWIKTRGRKTAYAEYIDYAKLPKARRVLVDAMWSAGIELYFYKSKGLRRNRGFAGARRIAIRNSVSDSDVFTTIAHELIHIGMSKLSPGDKAELLNAVTKEIKDSKVRKRIAAVYGNRDHTISEEAIAESNALRALEPEWIKQLASSHRSLIQKVYEKAMKVARKVSNYFENAGEKPSQNLLDIAKRLEDLALNPDFGLPKGKDEIRFLNAPNKRPVKASPSFVEDLFDVIRDGKGVEWALTPVSSVLFRIAPSLGRGLRNTWFRSTRQIESDYKKILPLGDAMKKLRKTPDDFAEYKKAVLNSDAATATRLATKHGFLKAHQAAQTVMAAIEKDMKRAGIQFNSINDYWPRVIHNFPRFKKWLNKSGQYSMIDHAIRKREKAMGHKMSAEEKDAFVGNIIRGYNDDALGLSTDSTKARVIVNLTDEMLGFYEDPEVALARHIRRSREIVAARDYLGVSKNPPPNGMTADDVISARVREMSQKYQLDHLQEKQIIAIHRAFFKNSRPTNSLIQAYRDLEYVDTMGSFTSALAQLEDVFLTLYEAGAIAGTVGVFKAVGQAARRGASLVRHRRRGKAGKPSGYVALDDLGISEIAHEMMNESGSANKVTRLTSKILETVFDLNFIRAFDAVGKESLVNGKLMQLQKQAQDGKFNAKNERLLNQAFENKAQVIADLKAGKVTEDVRLLLFHALSNVQPISPAEVPQGYLQMSNGKLFYMLKTFALRRLDFLRTEAFDSSIPAKQRAKNIALLSTILIAGGMTRDELVDWLLGRETDIGDRVIDNIAKLFGINKFFIYESRTDGPFTALVKMVAPPGKAIDSAARDIGRVVQGKDDKKEIVASVPVVGKLYYWWFGRGAERQERLRDQAGREPQYNWLGTPIDKPGFLGKVGESAKETVGIKSEVDYGPVSVPSRRYQVDGETYSMDLDTYQRYLRLAGAKSQEKIANAGIGFGKVTERHEELIAEARREAKAELLPAYGKESSSGGRRSRRSRRSRSRGRESGAYRRARSRRDSRR